MAARKLKPETKTLRYMVNGMGLVAGPASSRQGRFSFDLFGFIDAVGFAPILNGRPKGDACDHFEPMGKLPSICQNCRCKQHEHAGDRRDVASFLMVQATSSDHQANRQQKILGDEVLRARAFALISSGHQVEVWGWIRGRAAGAQGVRRIELRGTTPAGLVFHDKGITEVASELLVDPNR